MFPGYENKSPVYDAPPAISENVHARRKAQKEQAARDKARQAELGSSTEDKDETAHKNNMGSMLAQTGSVSGRPREGL